MRDLDARCSPSLVPAQFCLDLVSFHDLDVLPDAPSWCEKVALRNGHVSRSHTKTIPKCLSEPPAPVSFLPGFEWSSRGRETLGSLAVGSPQRSVFQQLAKSSDRSHPKGTGLALG